MIGTTIDRYKIVEELGHGGMSVVYRGVDTSLERDVAVKVLHNHLARKLENRKRFHREAKAIARLRHPNILSIFDFSSEDAERSYIVMEFVDGLNLREFLALHGPPPPEMAALVASEIANALIDAHDHGIIHRDLKPENIMVSGVGELKLMDFGIAHVIDAETMTQTGSLLGSPAHMAPELIEGEKVGPKVDVFALGTVLYWLSTGSLPFDGSNAPQVLKKVLEGEYVEAEDLDGRVGHELSGIISRCMAHRPEDRYSTVREVRSALIEFCEACEALEAHDLELKRYLTQPEAWCESFLEGIEDRLLARARAHLADGNVAVATRIFNRILAYDPQNAEVLRHLQSLHRRQWASRAAGAVIALATLIAIGVAIYDGTEPQPPSPVDTERVERAVNNGSLQAESVAAVSSEAAEMAATEKLATERGESVTKSAVARAMKFAEPAKAISYPARVKKDVLIAPVQEPDMGAADRTDMEAQKWVYKFRLAPAAAELNIDGQTIGSFTAAKGVMLEEGRYHLTARSKGCKPWRELLVVDGPQKRRMDVVLEWEEGVVKVLSDVDSVVYLDESKDIARRIEARRPATFRFDFGDADQKSLKRVNFRIAPVRDMKKIQRHRVTVRPGNVENLNVSFR